ncbi:hypothetical protein B296_00028690 [Ensete ventricosum]|uniref:RRM domain-containing protein n=1 Tax=Ensete ventricosum TaxID=4639 RepID=A0A427AMB9_ENSVE|nr:hypothetical protein B296_00028690 [Ensete ventricosum]
MPPRSAKKASGGSAGLRKTASRMAKGTPKAQSRPEVAEEPSKVEVVTAPVEEVKKEIKVDEVVVEKAVTEEPVVLDSDEDDVKEVYIEEDKGERLELEDNEPEDDPEDDAAVDYGEKDLENEVQEDYGDEGEEGEEDDMAEEEEEEEVDMVNEEIEDGGEDLEGEEDDENVEEGHAIDAEEEEHHEVVKEHKKRKEFEIFVGGLDKDATEVDLKKVFTKVGVITEIRLMMNPITKKNKGFAFLRFATVEQARRAVSELKSPVVRF